METINGWRKTIREQIARNDSRSPGGRDYAIERDDLERLLNDADRCAELEAENDRLRKGIAAEANEIDNHVPSESYDSTALRALLGQPARTEGGDD